jgi:hypothetical protein
MAGLPPAARPGNPASPPPAGKATAPPKPPAKPSPANIPAGRGAFYTYAHQAAAAAAANTRAGVPVSVAFQPGRGYYLRQGGATPAGGGDGGALAGVSPLQRYINQALGQLGTPLTDEQIQAKAQSYLSPLVQSLMDTLGRQAQSGTEAIRGYTSSLADAMRGYAGQVGQV